MNEISGELLNSTMEIQNATTSRDSGGSVIKTWATLVNFVPCRIVGFRGDEKNRGGRINANSTHKIYCNVSDVETYLSDITSTSRILSRDRYFDVTYVYNPDELDVYLIIECTEVQPSG